MKTFKINRNSWHYWINKNVFNEDERWMQQWEDNHSNFCSYWRATVFRLAWVAIVAAFVLTLLGILAVVSYLHPIQVLSVVLVSCAIIASLVGVVITHEYFKERKPANQEPKTLIGKQYATYKSKICPTVEFN